MQNLRPFLGAKDFEVSKQFYQGLGFSIDYDDGDLCVMSLGEIGFYLQRYYQKDWCDNSMVHVAVDNAQAWFEKAQALIDSQSFGVAKVAEPRVEGYGACVTYLWDPTGILWHLAQWDRGD
ncbi:MAG: hypothetical protein AAF541_00710 [Pseudomonadota bacterium]